MSITDSLAPPLSERRARWVEVGWYAGIVILIFGTGITAVFASEGLIPFGLGILVVDAVAVAACYCAYRLGKLSE